MREREREKGGDRGRRESKHNRGGRGVGRVPDTERDRERDKHKFR